jgi:hypothetical protein
VKAASGHQFDVFGIRAKILFENAADFHKLAFVMGCDDDLHEVLL